MSIDEMKEKIRYGAAELKAIYNKNLGIALGVSVGFHIALILLYIFSLNIGKAGSDRARAPINKINLTNVAPPQQNETPPPPPPMIPPAMQNTGGSGGVAARAGTPVAVPDALIDPKLKDFATTENIQVANPEAGDGTGLGDMGGKGLGGPIDLGDAKPLEKEELPRSDEFVAAEIEAKWDPADLQRRLKYPRVAEQNGIEGVVIVRALVDKVGKVRDVVIERSDNKILEEAAVDAVRSTPFTPAIQNKQNVATWVQVDVYFTLGN